LKNNCIDIGSIVSIVKSGDINGYHTGTANIETALIECETATELNEILGNGSVESGESMGDYMFNVLATSHKNLNQLEAYEKEAEELLNSKVIYNFDSFHFLKNFFDNEDEIIAEYKDKPIVLAAYAIANKVDNLEKILSFIRNDIKALVVYANFDAGNLTPDDLDKVAVYYANKNDIDEFIHIIYPLFVDKKIDYLPGIDVFSDEDRNAYIIKLINNRVKIQALKDEAAKSAPHAIYYALTNNRPFPEGEEVIASHPASANSYASMVLNSRWSKGEPAILKNVTMALSYIREIIKDEWPEAEPLLLTEPNEALSYLKEFKKARWLELEDLIVNSKREKLAERYLNIIKKEDPSNYEVALEKFKQ